MLLGMVLWEEVRRKRSQALIPSLCGIFFLHMSPVDQAGSVTKMKLVSVHMVTFSPLFEMKNLKKW